jgi:S1-C subfamily serine protease
MTDFWRRFFGDQPGPNPFRGPPGGGAGLGSGVLIDPGGLVLTNHHVVEGASEVRVRTADEKEYLAEVRGTDPAT